jgi:anaerobic selenocysteine-containing dehydrogenase
MLERKATSCIHCSLACPYLLDVEDGDPVGLEYDAASPVTAGGLCARGNLAYELLRLPGRLDVPLVRGQPARWPEALSRLADEIERQPAGSVGLVLGADATAEEAGLAGRFAAECLSGAPAAIGFLSNEPAVLAEAAAAPDVPETRLAELGKANVVIAVGDLFALAPVISRRALDAKYGARGNALVYLGRDEGLTARLAGMKLTGASERRAALALLRELPGAGKSLPADVSRAIEPFTKADLAVKGPLPAAAKAAAGAQSVAVIAASVDPVAVRLAKLIAAALGPSASFLAMTEAAGAREILAAWRPEADLAAVVKAAMDGRLRGAIALGLDAVSAAGAYGGALTKLPLLAAGACFDNPTTKAAGFVLPVKLWAEKSGTVVAPGLAHSYGWILRGLAREMGKELAGRPAAAQARPMSIPEAVKAAAESAEGPRAGWTAREPSDPALRAALAGVYVA